MVAEEDEHDADSETRRSGGTRDDDDADWVREGDDDSVRAVGVNSTFATIASVVELQAQTQQTASNASGGEAGASSRSVSPTRGFSKSLSVSAAFSPRILSSADAGAAATSSAAD